MNIYYDFFFNWQTEKKNVLDQSEVCFLFQLLKLRKIKEKIEKKTNFVVWWFDPMSSLFVVCNDVKLKICSFVMNLTGFYFDI